MPLDVSTLTLDLVALAPVFLLGVVAIGMLFLGLVAGKERSGLLAGVALLGLVAAAAFVLPAWGAPRSAFGQMARVDGFYAFFTLLVLSATALSILLSARYVERSGLAYPEYYALMMFGTAGMIVMVAASNLILLLIGLELLSLALYVLVGFARTRITSEEAALKYFLLGAFAFGLMIYGSALIYGESGSLDYAAIAETARRGGGPLLLVGFGLLLAGVAFKLSLVPFHMWVPDVYEGAPTPVTAFMAVGTKVAVFAALARLLSGALPALQAEWAAVLAASAAITMVVGNLAAVVQSNLKRLLAYSAIAHAGYIVMALLSGEGATSGAVLFYLVAYTAMNFGAFAIVVAVGEGREQRLLIRDYAGLARRNPWLSAAMALFMLSLAGVPPTAGFLAKLYVISAAVEGGYLWLAAVAVATSIVAVFYYLKVVVAMYMSDPGEDQFPLKASGSVVAVAAVAAAVTLQLGLLPDLLFRVTQLSVAHLAGM